MNVFTCAASVLSILALSIGAPAVARELPPILVGELNAVPACATPDRLTTYLRLRNPQLEERFGTIAAEYQRHGESLGLRWDYAFFQMIVETGHLTFKRPDGTPSRISARQNNFAGLGVETRPTGRSFKNLTAGVVAHLQEIAGLADDEATFAEVAEAWVEDGHAYGSAIATVARRFYETQCGGIGATAAATTREIDVVSGTSEPQLRAEPVLRHQGFLRTGLAARSIEVPDFETTFAMEAAHVIPAFETPPGGPFEYDNSGLISAFAFGPSQRTVEPRSARVVSEVADSVVAPSTGKSAFATANAVAMLTPAPRPEPQKPVVDSPEDSVRKMVAGRTVLLDTPVGSTIPITFTENGTMRGKAGSLSSYLGAEVDEGKWWVTGARLCQRWRVWFDRETQCLTLRQAGKIVHWSSDKGHSGTARIVPPK